MRYTFAIITFVAEIAISAQGAGLPSAAELETADYKAADDKTADITVTAEGFPSENGVALFMLYDARASFLKIDKARQLVRVKPTGTTASAVFKNVPEGIYAVSVLHDANENRKLDFRLFPLPHSEEAVGTSNNVRSRFGPPSFADSAFRLGSDDVRLKIALRFF